MRTLSIILLALLATACASSEATTAPPEPVPAASTPTSTVVSASDVAWEQLNPARGDKSPKAGTLWGDRNGSDPTGFLVEFVDGFSSPPHIHNVSYRGVVITGLVHNDAPDAKETWMPTGSYWTQPKGGVHITAAKGEKTVAYIEIEQGPYLVLPIEEAFETGETPINLDASKIGWSVPPDMPVHDPGVEVAVLWGTPKGDQPNGTLVRLSPGFAGEISAHGSAFRVVVIQGRLEHRVPGETDAKTLTPGSYASSSGGSTFPVSCAAAEDCILYVRATVGSTSGRS